MKFFTFKPDKFFEYLELKNLKQLFSLSTYYYNKDVLYQDQQRILWVSFEDFDIPILIISTALKDAPFKNTYHILTYEVNRNFRGSGIGKEMMIILRKKFFKKPISLRCDNNIVSFYTKLGFKIIESNQNSNLLRLD